MWHYNWVSHVTGSLHPWCRSITRPFPPFPPWNASASMRRRIRNYTGKTIWGTRNGSTFYTCFPLGKIWEFLPTRPPPPIGRAHWGRSNKVLLALQNISWRESSEPTHKAISQFITVRELSDRPVAVHHQERGSWWHIHREVGD